MKLFPENKANVTLQDMKKSKYHFFGKNELVTDYLRKLDYGQFCFSKEQK